MWRSDGGRARVAAGGRGTRAGAWSRLVGLLVAVGLAGCDVGTGPEMEEVLGVAVLDGQELGSEWAWTSAAEIAYIVGAGTAIQVVDAGTGATRPLVAAEGSTPITRFQHVAPFLYFARAGAIHRVPVAGGATEPMTDLPGGAEWAVSADHQWLIWADGRFLIRESLAGGARDTLETESSNAGHRVFAAPDGTAVLVVEWGRWPGRLVRGTFGGDVVTGRTPCPVEEGSVVAWEDAAPALYAACPDAFVRQEVEGDTMRLATIGGGRDGTWAPDLMRVSAWRRNCPRWSNSVCPEAERELWIAVVGETPVREGTLVLDARQTLDDTGPAYFAPGGARIAFRLDASSEHDGLRVLRLD